MSQVTKPFRLALLIDQGALNHPPVCPSDKVPFLSALVMVGRSSFGEAWADAGRSAAKIAAPPGDISDLEALWARIQMPLPQPGDPPTPGPAEARAKLETVHAQMVKRHEANERAVAHVHQAVAKLRLAVIDRKVATYWRKDKAGAVFRTLPVEQLLNEQTNLLRFGYIWNDQDRCAHHVFLDRAQLELFCQTLNAGTVGNFDRLPLSREMRLALAVIAEWGIGPENRPSVEAIASQIEDIAKRDGPALSPRRAKEIARLARGMN